MHSPFWARIAGGIQVGLTPTGPAGGGAAGNGAGVVGAGATPVAPNATEPHSKKIESNCFIVASPVVEPPPAHPHSP